MEPNKLPKSLDLSVLEYLEHGDYERIAIMDRKSGHKTHRSHVSAIVRGKHRNMRILSMAFDVAMERKSRFPKQAIITTQL